MGRFSVETYPKRLTRMHREIAELRAAMVPVDPVRHPREFARLSQKLNDRQRGLDYMRNLHHDDK